MFKPVLDFLERFGNVVGRTLLTVVYFAAVGPIAVVYTLVSDVLMTRRAPPSTYRPWVSYNHSLDEARRQD